MPNWNHGFEAETPALAFHSSPAASEVTSVRSLANRESKTHRSGHERRPVPPLWGDGVPVPAACGCIVLVDADVLGRLGGRGVSVGSHGYSQVWDGRVVLLHRYLLGLDVGDPRVVDHVNRDRLDNRRTNLRVCSRAENNRNRAARNTYPTASGRWEGKVQIDGIRHFLGTFPTEAQALRAVATFRSTLDHDVIRYRDALDAVAHATDGKLLPEGGKR